MDPISKKKTVFSCELGKRGKKKVKGGRRDGRPIKRVPKLVSSLAIELATMTCMCYTVSR